MPPGPRSCARGFVLSFALSLQQAVPYLGSTRVVVAVSRHGCRCAYALFINVTVGVACRPVDGFHPSQSGNMVMAGTVRWVCVSLCGVALERVIRRCSLRCRYAALYACVMLQIWEFIEERHPDFLGPVNPNNAEILQLFGDQGGYGN